MFILFYIYFCDFIIFKAQAKKTGQIMVQVEGETKATEFFPLKNACDDEENADVDVFKAIDSDLGKVRFSFSLSLD